MHSSAQRHDCFTLRVTGEGYVALTWTRGVHVTGPLAREAIAALDRLNAGRERGLLVDMTGTAVLARDARKAFTEKCSASAVALVGASAVDRTIANFALGVSTMPVPARFFTSERQAAEWLRDVDAGR